MNANWNSNYRYWNVNANSVENPNRWNAGRQVLSRYYFLSSAFINELDQFVKHKLKIRYYIRYADDFVIFSEDKNYLENLIPLIREFL